MPIDGTDSVRSISTIGQPLRFPTDTTLTTLPIPDCDTAHATISYIRQVSSDTRFAKKLVPWLIEEHQQRHHEQLNSTKAIV